MNREHEIDISKAMGPDDVNDSILKERRGENELLNCGLLFLTTIASRLDS